MKGWEIYTLNKKYKRMKNALLWITIGLISGVVLAVFLIIPQILWEVKAYNLLFEVSYIPWLNKMHPVWLIQGIFHFTTCIFSLCVLYYLDRKSTRLNSS